MPQHSPLTVEQIQTVLDECLDVEFTFIKTEDAAQRLAGIDREDQDFILTWVKRVASTNIQVAYQFISQTIDALTSLDKPVLEAWALHAMDMYDQRGLRAALDVIQNVQEFIFSSHQRAHGAVFTNVSSVLSHFVHGLSGRALKLEEGEVAYTDTETLFLPPVIARLDRSQDNFRLYKLMAAYLWAQTRFGTFRIPLQKISQQQKQPEKFLKLFHALDSVRLEACIERELPGLYRDMQDIKQRLGEDSSSSAWIELANHLSGEHASVDDVLQMAVDLADSVVPAPPVNFYHGELRPEAVQACMQARLLKEKAALRTALRKISDELAQKPAGELAPKVEPDFKAKKLPDPTEPDGFHMEITIDGKPVALPEDVKELSKSIVQDLGDIPDDYLEPAGPGEYDPTLFKEKEPDPDEVWKGTYHEEGAFLYQEWDYQRQHYRKNWCAVREKTVTPVHDDFIRKTLNKYTGLIKHLRKTFEAMRDEDRLLKRQVYGDGVDIDALVEALADAKDGSEMSERLFTRMHRTERNIAVCFMVDMSGSTKGWINEAERESLVLLAETLETLGDRYAIYGFSGMARKRCEIYKIKGFDEQYNDEIKARISGIEPKDYTRMGFAIRHLTKILNEVEAKTRVLITLSDGKPDDYDTYRGEYGIEDTRRALIEARHDGIHPYCITIDKEARDYLPHMYGPAAFTVIDEVYKLPLKVSDIYRRLTT
jgi:nitric oxide reductase NorD protein